MTPESQKWRDHFARCEEEQRLLFPPRAPQTQLESAQHEIARAFLRAEFPLERWNRLSDFLDAFRGDEPTRFAFFEHFGVNRARNIFCFTGYEWKAVVERFKQSPDEVRAFSSYWHEFQPYSQMKEEEIDWAFRKALLEELDRKHLFIRRYGSVYGPLAGKWCEELWHWNGESLVQLREFGSLSVS